MTPPDTFDLEPEHDLDRPGDPLPPVRPGLHRTRTVGPPPRRTPAPFEAKGAGGGGLAALFGWAVSPTFYYVLALVGALGALLGLFNPWFGSAGRFWPYEALGGGADPVAWGPAQVRVVSLLAAIAAAAAALCMRPGRGRASLVAVAFLLPLLAFDGPVWPLLPALIGLLAGTLIAGTPGRRQRSLLAVALIMLGGHLCMPRGLEAGSSAEVGHASGLVLVVEAYTNPADGVGWMRIVAEQRGETVALILLAVGVFALIGLGRHWVRWAAGGLLLAAYLGSAAWMLHANWDGWQAGVGGWAEGWYGACVAYMLPFAGAVAELRRTRI